MDVLSDSVGFEHALAICAESQRLVQQLRPFLANCSSFVEVGCGHGALVQALNAAGVDGFGCDLERSPAWRVLGGDECFRQVDARDLEPVAGDTTVALLAIHFHLEGDGEPSLAQLASDKGFTLIALLPCQSCCQWTTADMEQLKQHGFDVIHNERFDEATEKRLIVARRAQIKALA